MKIIIKIGDVLNAPADVLISTANPWLNRSGGVNGAIREATGPELQTELHELPKQQGRSALPAGTVVHSNAYTLPFKHTLYAVAKVSTKETAAHVFIGRPAKNVLTNKASAPTEYRRRI